LNLNGGPMLNLAMERPFGAVHSLQNEAPMSGMYSTNSMTNSAPETNDPDEEWWLVSTIDEAL
jgi:hypothetical protein